MHLPISARQPHRGILERAFFGIEMAGAAIRFRTHLGIAPHSIR